MACQKVVSRCLAVNLENMIENSPSHKNNAVRESSRFTGYRANKLGVNILFGVC